MSSLGAAPRALAPLGNARAAASRKNGAKSRGPKTPDGKARSAQNALKHGLRARTYVVLPEEDAAAFQELEAALMAELAPDGALQTVLARRVVAASWRLERAERLEVEIFGHETYEMFGKADLGLALIRDCNGAGAFDTLLRYRGGTLAELWRALRTLKALQAERAAQAGIPAPAPRPIEPEARGNPGESDRPGGPADAGKGDVNLTPAWPPSWPFPTPGPAPCTQPIEPEGHGKPAESPPPSSPNRTAARNGSASLLAGTALAYVGRPGGS